MSKSSGERRPPKETRGRGALLPVALAQTGPFSSPAAAETPVGVAGAAAPRRKGEEIIPATALTTLEMAFRGEKGCGSTTGLVAAAASKVWRGEPQREARISCLGLHHWNCRGTRLHGSHATPCEAICSVTHLGWGSACRCFKTKLAAAQLNNVLVFKTAIAIDRLLVDKRAIAFRQVLDPDLYFEQGDRKESDK